ncbi:biotin/lipoyl-containing protein [Tissierellaceae bacterium HCP3S3_D8]
MRKFIINVNGNSYEVEVEEVSNEEMASRQVSPDVPRNPLPVEKKPVSKPQPIVEERQVVVSDGQEVVEAPMPGNILRIAVSEGDMVKSGDILLILEAMKMENEILAPRDGKVASITTTEGSVVNTGEKLVIIE